MADVAKGGGRVIAGGRCHALGGTFLEPTILADITPGMKAAKEEIIGPVAPLFRFTTDDDAIRIANDTEFGLAACFYWHGIRRVRRVGERADRAFR